MELQIAYCDDEIFVGQMFAQKITSEFQRQGIRVSVTLLNDPKRFLAMLESGCLFDAVFLDIDMPGLDGITLGKRLTELALNIEIVFLSNKEELVYRAFQVKPLRFLRKSKFDAEISEAVRAVLNAKQETERKTVVFEDGNHVYRFSPREILYVEIRNQTLTVVRSKDSVSFRSTIAAAQEALSPYGFLRIHKSYLVNYRAIFSIKKEGVLLENGTNLPISKHRYQEVLQQFLRFHRKETEKAEE